MSAMTKLFIVLSAVFSLTLSALTVAGASQWGRMKSEIDNRDRLLLAEFTRRTNLESTFAMALATKDDQIAALQTQLTKEKEANRSLTDELATTKNDLARQTNEKVASEAGRKKLEEILGVQTAQNTSLQKENQELFARNTELETRNQKLASRNLEIVSNLSVATDQIRNLQEKLYALEQSQSGTRVSSAAGVTTPVANATPVKPSVPGPIRGEITELDGAYASVNIGEASGVVPGMMFMIYRGNQYLGDLEIETVRPKEAGGKLRTVTQAIRPGDRIAFGL